MVNQKTCSGQAMEGKASTASDFHSVPEIPAKQNCHGGCWCVSKGLAGMISQMSGLAHALGLKSRTLTTRLRFPWTIVPTSLVPTAAFVLQEPQQLLQAPPPRVVISCGRHGVIPSLWLKKKYGDAVFTVQIQDPRVDPSQFDLVVVTRHDYIRGDNVYLTTGAIHYVTPERLQAAGKSRVAQMIAVGDRPIVAVLIGGPNGYYSFSDHDVHEFVRRLHNVTHSHNVRLVVLPSNRTPVRITDRLQAEFGAKHFVWDRQTENPYFAALALASHFVVTGDSVSMVTEAASTGRPVFVQYLTEKRRSTRFTRFHQMFAEDGITRPFDGTLADWFYSPPNDTFKVAQIIQERIALHESSACIANYNYAA